MTNKEYFARYNISFADAIKEYDEKKHGTFDMFLKLEREVGYKYKLGDIITCYNGVINIVYDIDLGQCNYKVVRFSPGMRTWGCDCLPIHAVDAYNDAYLVGHSELGFAVKLGLINEDDIGKVMCYKDI